MQMAPLKLSPINARRWRNWLQEQELATITLLPDAQAARRWAGLDAAGPDRAHG